MRILFVTTEFPWPPTGGGRRRTLAQLCALAAIGEVEQVTILSAASAPVPASVREDLRAAIVASTPARVIVRPPERHPVHLLDFPAEVPRVLVRRVLHDQPYLVAKWACPALRAEFRRALRTGQHDLVYFDHLGATAYQDEVAGEVRVLIEQHNVESDLVARYAAQQRGLKRRLAEREARATRRYEARVMNEAQLVVTISPRDTEQCRWLTKTPVHFVPMAAPVLPRARRERSPALCYFGSLRWQPNVAGLDWFCQRVWPLVRARVGNATLEIAGSDLVGKEPPRRWRAAGVSFIGLQGDLSALVARSRALVAPIVGGSGMSVKVLDGLAAGLAVVTTSDGAAGLAVTPGRELLVGDDAAGLAEHVVAVLRDSALCNALASAGQAFVAERHSALHTVAALRRAIF